MRKMTREDIIRMAREAGIKFSPAQFSGVLEAEIDEFSLETFAALVAAASEAKEREACAKVCDDLPPPDGYNMTEISFWDVTSLECAAAIRARGQA
jgi:hypothetical protein